MSIDEIAKRLDESADTASRAWSLCNERGNREQAEYNLGRREALRWAAQLVRKALEEP